MSRKDISDLQVVEAYVKAMELKVWPYQILKEATGQPIKVCCAAMERAYKRGFLDYGVSLRAGFLTQKGKKLIEDKGQL